MSVKYPGNRQSIILLKVDNTHLLDKGRSHSINGKKPSRKNINALCALFLFLMMNSQCIFFVGTSIMYSCVLINMTVADLFCSDIRTILIFTLSYVIYQ